MGAESADGADAGAGALPAMALLLEVGAPPTPSANKQTYEKWKRIKDFTRAKCTMALFPPSLEKSSKSLSLSHEGHSQLTRGPA